MSWPKRNLPRPQTDKALAAYRRLPKGSSIEIGALAGVRHEYVRTVLQRNGIELATKHVPKPPRTTPVRKYRRLQDWEVEAIANAYADGEKLSSLAVEFGVDDSTVSRVAERRGHPRRTGPTLKTIRRVKREPAENMQRYKRRLAAQRRASVAARAAG